MYLFSPIRICDVEIPNRIAISPMSQYRATNGFANDWHLIHLGRFALGGAGLVFCEATAVEDRGRRTPGDLGIWQDDHIADLARIVRFLEAEGAVPGIQLAHAGRKASERRPWHGESPLDDDDVALRGEAPWTAIAPSAVPYGDRWPAPREMTLDDIAETVAAFGAAAARSLAAGFRVIEVYAAHGFLVHEFYSPIANRRTDAYGGSFDGRARFALEVAEAIRRVWPERLPLIFRLSATDWLEGGWTVDETIELARRLKVVGVNVIDCSSGGIGGAQPPPRLPLGHGFQVPFAERVRREAAVPTMTVGMIWDPAEADAIVSDGRADLVALAREVLDDPNWPLHAHAALNDGHAFSMWKREFGWWLARRDRIVRKLGLRESKRAHEQR